MSDDSRSDRALRHFGTRAGGKSHMHTFCHGKKPVYGAADYDQSLGGGHCESSRMDFNHVGVNPHRSVHNNKMARRIITDCMVTYKSEPFRAK